MDAYYNHQAVLPRQVAPVANVACSPLRDSTFRLVWLENRTDNDRHRPPLPSRVPLSRQAVAVLAKALDFPSPSRKHYSSGTLPVAPSLDKKCHLGTGQVVRVFVYPLPPLCLHGPLSTLVDKKSRPKTAAFRYHTYMNRFSFQMCVQPLDYQDRGGLLYIYWPSSHYGREERSKGRHHTPRVVG